MKKITLHRALISIASVCCAFIGYSDVYAAGQFESVQDCYNKSDGRSHIPSVKWVCEDEKSSWEAGQNVCSAWLGAPGDSKSLVIESDVDTYDSSTVVHAKYYGMCTKESNTTASLTASNDNGSIDDSTNLTRGTWGNPGNGLETTINVKKFLDTSKPGDPAMKVTTDGDYKVYTRHINVRRCHGGNAGSCSDQDQDISIRIKQPSTTFEGKVELSSAPSGATYNSSKNKYYIDATSTSFEFKDYMKRNNNGKSSNVSVSWWAYQDKASSSYVNNSKSLAKDSGWQLVKTHTRNNVSLNVGDNVFCEKIGYKTTVSYSGSASGWGEKEVCITIHRYSSATYEGRVVPYVNDTAKSANKSASNADTVWVDSNNANLRFEHQLKRTNSVSAKTWYKTAKSTGTTSYDFSEQTSQADSTAGTSWKTEFKSNASNISVDAARSDTNISTYCQNLYYYASVRDDRGAHSDNYTTKTGCVKIRPYKTTFTGAIKIEVKINGTWTEYNNGDSISFSGSDVPEDVPVRFTHTVTRSSSDAHGSPNNKKTYIYTTVSSSGVRSGDPAGTAISKVNSGGLAAGGSFSKKNEFTTKIYPEQTITLCQKLYFKDRIWGTDEHEGNVGQYCITLTKSVIACMSQNFGIKNAKNYLKMEIYKNGSSAANSGRLDTTKTDPLVVWAKPNDYIRYKYDLCAAGELASQFTDHYITTYSIGSSQAGYLFGKTLSSSPYTATSKEIGRSSTTPGVGPFTDGSNHKYEITVYSPSTNASLYNCAGGTASYKNNYYRIPGINTSASNSATLRSNCQSDDYGNVSDVGKTFSQTASWTDLWYSNGSAVNGHKGTANATVTGTVKVPYNYKTSVSTTATGGNAILGQTIGASVKIGVSGRRNSPVSGSDYATYTKSTRYRLVQITIAPESTLAASTFNTDINAQEYTITDTTGNANLASKIAHCGDSYISCSVVKSDSGAIYEETASSQTITSSSYNLTIPDSNSSSYRVGTKICFIAGIWPSDSHGLVDTSGGSTTLHSTISSSDNQNEALTEGGSRWHLSKASCFTVAKRPSMASIGGDLYAPSSIQGITSKRNKDAAGNKALFGSWSEYNLISGINTNSSKGEIKGFASGATLYGGGTTSSVTRTCYFSSMSFTNANCTSYLGKLPVDKTSASYPDRLSSQIIARYTSRSSSDAIQNDAKLDIAGDCTYDSATGTYKPTRSGYKCLSNGSKYIRTRQSVSYLSWGDTMCMGIGDTNTSRTIVVDAEDKTLVVAGNMSYGSPSGAGNTHSYGCRENVYTSISQIPQLIMIAKHIIFKQDVTHLDGWLIADEVTTCDPTPIGTWNSTVNRNSINSENCNKQLTINGPVITKKLNLYRTAGMNGYETNGQPAEIFYLGPETYLWSYNQAQRFSQATTTYQRELAPRY